VWSYAAGDILYLWDGFLLLYAAFIALICFYIIWIDHQYSVLLISMVEAAVSSYTFLLLLLLVERGCICAGDNAQTAVRSWNKSRTFRRRALRRLCPAKQHFSSLDEQTARPHHPCASHLRQCHAQNGALFFVTLHAALDFCLQCGFLIMPPFNRSVNFWSVVLEEDQLSWQGNELWSLQSPRKQERLGDLDTVWQC